MDGDPLNMNRGCNLICLINNLFNINGFDEEPFRINKHVDAKESTISFCNTSFLLSQNSMYCF